MCTQHWLLSRPIGRPIVASASGGGKPLPPGGIRKCAQIPIYTSRATSVLPDIMGQSKGVPVGPWWETRLRLAGVHHAVALSGDLFSSDEQLFGGTETSSSCRPAPPPPARGFVLSRWTDDLTLPKSRRTERVAGIRGAHNAAWQGSTAGQMWLGLAGAAVQCGGRSGKARVRVPSGYARLRESVVAITDFISKFPQMD